MRFLPFASTAVRGLAWSRGWLPGVLLSAAGLAQAAGPAVLSAPAAPAAGLERTCATAPVEKACAACGTADRVAGVVEAICDACQMADIAGGGHLGWDVLTVRLTAPQPLAGTRIDLRVLIEDAKPPRYAPCAQIAFDVNAAAIAAGSAMLDQDDIAPL